MPWGVIINSLAVILGGLLGVFLGRFFQKEFCKHLTMIFGIISMSMGISGIIKVENLPAVVLAVIVGLILGELCGLEKKFSQAAGFMKRPVEKLFGNQQAAGMQEEEMGRFISVVILFCASGTGIFGSLQSGITGDHTILFSKSILDFFTAAIFAVSLGHLVMAVAVPQFIIYLFLFFCAHWIMPLTNASMLNDFSACGGILMLATGFRIAEIKKEIPIANLLPAMVLVMPFSAFWSQIFG